MLLHRLAAKIVAHWNSRAGRVTNSVHHTAVSMQHMPKGHSVLASASFYKTVARSHLLCNALCC